MEDVICAQSAEIFVWVPAVSTSDRQKPSKNRQRVRSKKSK